MEESNAQDSNAATQLKGGWRTSPFLLGSILGLSVAFCVWYSNLIVFLMSEFNVESIKAAQINNITSGFTSFFPIVAAILADSVCTSYSITLAFSFVSLLGVIMFTMIVTVNALKPQSCTNTTSTMCVPPTRYQYVFLYTAIAIGLIGAGGTRFILATMGASQLKKVKHQSMFLDWSILMYYIAAIIGCTILVYIEDNVSWALGFGVSIVANVIFIVIFLCGTPFYRPITPQGSPFTSIARVFVAWARKFKMVLPLESENMDCYYYQDWNSSLDMVHQVRA